MFSLRVMASFYFVANLQILVIGLLGRGIHVLARPMFSSEILTGERRLLAILLKIRDRQARSQGGLGGSSPLKFAFYIFFKSQKAKSKKKSIKMVKIFSSAPHDMIFWLRARWAAQRGPNVYFSPRLLRNVKSFL